MFPTKRQVLVFDVRYSYEYKGSPPHQQALSPPLGGHIPGAINIYNPLKVNELLFSYRKALENKQFCDLLRKHENINDVDLATLREQCGIEEVVEGQEEEEEEE